jgi:hypothetical protein
LSFCLPLLKSWENLMTFAKFATNAPLVIFVSACLAFAGWLVYDSVKGPAATAGRTEREYRHMPSVTPGQSGPTPGTVPMPTPMGGANADALLDQLQLGTSRIDTERALIALLPPFVEPVDMSSGSPVLRSRYRVYLSRYRSEMTPDITQQDFLAGSYRLVLEFDGQVHHHPLRSIKITLPKRP